MEAEPKQERSEPRERTIIWKHKSGLRKKSRNQGELRTVAGRRKLSELQRPGRQAAVWGNTKNFLGPG